MLIVDVGHIMKQGCPSKGTAPYYKTIVLTTRKLR